MKLQQQQQQQLHPLRLHHLLQSFHQQVQQQQQVVPPHFQQVFKLLPTVKEKWLKLVVSMSHQLAYSVQPVSGTNNADLTNPNSNGVTFQSLPNTNGLFGTNSQPLYTIDLTFNPAGVNSLSSVVANVGTNVDKFSVEFFDLLNPTQLFTYSTQPGALPVSYTSTNTNSQASLVNFPDNAPSDLAGIRISILSTKNNQ